MKSKILPNQSVLAPRKTIDNSRRFSKVSTHGPVEIANLIFKSKNGSQKNEGSLKDSQNSKYEAQKLKSQSSYSEDSVIFQINIEHASSIIGNRIQIKVFIDNSILQSDVNSTKSKVFRNINKFRMRIPLT